MLLFEGEDASRRLEDDWPFWLRGLAFGLRSLGCRMLPSVGSPLCTLSTGLAGRKKVYISEVLSLTQIKGHNSRGFPI